MIGANLAVSILFRVAIGEPYQSRTTTEWPDGGTICLEK
jgi:hypothetical protein